MECLSAIHPMDIEAPHKTYASLRDVAKAENREMVALALNPLDAKYFFSHPEILTWTDQNKLLGTPFIFTEWVPPGHMALRY